MPGQTALLQLRTSQVLVQAADQVKYVSTKKRRSLRGEKEGPEIELELGLFESQLEETSQRGKGGKRGRKKERGELHNSSKVGKGGIQSREKKKEKEDIRVSVWAFQ